MDYFSGYSEVDSEVTEVVDSQKYGKNEGNGQIVLEGAVKKGAEQTELCDVEIDGKGTRRLAADKLKHNEVVGHGKRVTCRQNDDGDLLLSMPPVNAAPVVDTLQLQADLEKNRYIRADQTILYTNPELKYMSAPLQGPLTPLQLSRGGHLRQVQNHHTGDIQPLHIDELIFNQQYHNVQCGHSDSVVDPSDFMMAGKLRTFQAERYEKAVKAREREEGGTESCSHHDGHPSHGGADSSDMDARFIIHNNAVADDNETVLGKGKAKRLKNNDSSSDEYQGPWARYAKSSSDTELDLERNAKWGLTEEEIVKGTVALSSSIVAGQSKKRLKDGGDNNSSRVGGEETSDEKMADTATSVFHGKSERDFQGRSWCDIPSDWKERQPDDECFLPKKEIHTFVGHTGAVQSIRFFPRSGHLLLSSSMDSTVKIWSTRNQRNCMRTYKGHNQAVREVNFNHDGTRFFSCSYDLSINEWDTEYGKIVGKLTCGRTPYCVTVHPDPSQQNIIICGCSNNRAVQFDTNTGQIVQEYSEHLQPVNTVTFVDNNRKIITTSDDKKIFLWDFGIPVVVKYISEPHMHAIAAVSTHPSEKYIVCQSADNQIITYSSIGRFKFLPKKKFKGHMSAGYAIKPGFSPDGRWMSSGDGHGRVFFWDWKGQKTYRTLNAHSKVCMGTEWHPSMQSRVATCGWDGLIKYWD